MDFSKEMKELFFMQQVYAVLFSLANKLQIEGDKYFGEITSRQFMTMLAILHLPQAESTHKNIAGKLGTSKQNVTQLITSLEKKGYVKTVPCPHDKRAVNSLITDLGMQVMAECNQIGLRFFADVFHEFNIEELETLWRLLKKLMRFDGDEDNGFEEDVTAPDAVMDEASMKALKEFARLRNQ